MATTAKTTIELDGRELDYLLASIEDRQDRLDEQRAIAPNLVNDMQGDLTDLADKLRKARSPTRRGAW